MAITIPWYVIVTPGKNKQKTRGPATLNQTPPILHFVNRQPLQHLPLLTLLSRHPFPKPFGLSRAIRYPAPLPDQRLNTPPRYPPPCSPSPHRSQDTSPPEADGDPLLLTIPMVHNPREAKEVTECRVLRGRPPRLPRHLAHSEADTRNAQTPQATAVNHLPRVGV